MASRERAVRMRKTQFLGRFPPPLSQKLLRELNLPRYKVKQPATTKSEARIKQANILGRGALKKAIAKLKEK
ncbi:hypothetical protein HZB89_00300, partial [archaeon]|nr:hypothetical protein [archaeon]